MINCKRCGKELKSIESIKRGYGKVCYRIIQLQETSKQEVKPEINQEIDFLKLEIRTLKRMIRNIQINGTTKPIERIKQNRPEQKADGNESNFGLVVGELKEIFSKIKNGYKHLKPTFPIEEIIISSVILA